MKTDEQDDLWRLLGNARTPSVSPFFSRNVLRAIREEKQEKTGAFTRVLDGISAVTRSYGRWALLGASMCILVAVSGQALLHRKHAPMTAQVGSAPAPDQVVVLAQQVSGSPDYQVINHLDELLASEETSVWLDK